CPDIRDLTRRVAGDPRPRLRSRRIMTEPLDPSCYRDLVRRALQEDIGDGDVTTAAIVPGSQRARGVFVVKAACVIAGLDVAFEALRQLAAHVEATVRRRDGESCTAGEELATISGTAAALLSGERTALNFLQRLSGIATRARRFVDAAGGRITVL